VADAELIWDGPKRGAARLLLAHGAGADMHSPFMRVCAQALAERGISVVRFNFPYMERRRERGVRSPPDRAPVLLEHFGQVVAQLGAAQQLIIGGKSMGGRIASMIADELGVAGLVCLGYPFHPPGKLDKTRTAHLAALRTPCLIVQGTRDAFGTREDVSNYVLSPRVNITWIEGGNHDLKVPAYLTKRAPARKRATAATTGERNAANPKTEVSAVPLEAVDAVEHFVRKSLRRMSKTAGHTGS